MGDGGKRGRRHVLARSDPGPHFRMWERAVAGSVARVHFSKSVDSALWPSLSLHSALRRPPLNDLRLASSSPHRLVLLDRASGNVVSSC